MKQLESIVKNNSIECISFDIFDTLIIRNLDKPTDLYSIMQLSDQYKTLCNACDFKKIRIQAEKEANQLKKSATLIDIYEKIKFIAGIENIDALMKLEIDIEQKVCQPNIPVINFYNYCLKCGKKVVITSDMYLPSVELEKILQVCGIYRYEKIYVSCEVKKSKAEGTIFEHIANDIHLNKKEILHIGDNFKSDYVNALRCGMNAYHYKPEVLSEFKNIEDKNNNDLIYRTLNSISKALAKKDSYSYNLGLRAFGPLLASFCQWLNFEFKKNNIKKIYFLSRDGLIVKEIFDQTDTFNYHTQYLFASRRSWIVPLLWKHPELSDILARISMSPRITIGIFLNRVGLKPDRYIDLLDSFGLVIDTFYKKEDLFKDKRFIELFEIIKQDIIDNSKNEYLALKKYILDNVSNEKIALVDIGYNGTMQYAIEELLKEIHIESKIVGYYVGLNPKAQLILEHKINAKGFIYEPGRNEDQCNNISSYIAIFEVSFLAHHGSVERFEIVNGEAKPVYYQYEYDETDRQIVNEKDFIVQYQKGAIDFTKYWLDNPYFKNILIDPLIGIINMNLMGRKPNKFILKSFGNFRVFDTQISIMACPKKKLWYIVHPNELKRDFIGSVWKIGFLSRLFGTRFPSERLYHLMKRYLYHGN